MKSYSVLSSSVYVPSASKSASSSSSTVEPKTVATSFPTLTSSEVFPNLTLSPPVTVLPVPVTKLVRLSSILDAAVLS